MHTRRLAAFLLGGWFAGSLLMVFVATQNFRNVDRVLEAPPPAARTMIDSLGHDPARRLLRYLASESNRFYFRNWERAQIALGLGLGMSLLFATERRLIPILLAGSMLAIAAFQYVALTPEITYLGKLLDFPAEPVDSQWRRFWMMHNVYSVMEVTKMGMGMGLAAYLFWFRPRRRSRTEVNSVDHADHRHVDR